MITKIFLASSLELKVDREQLEIFIDRKNQSWNDKGIFLELVVWEDSLDAMSRTRLQDEYNRAIRECDIFVMLLSTKVGQYTEEEFETAFGQFQSASRPLIYAYFKDVEVGIRSIQRKDLISLWAFGDKLENLERPVHLNKVYKTRTLG
jgi:hypothetical protein